MPVIVGHSGPFTSRLAIFGEGPGPDEERLSVPFIGKSGSHLTTALGGQGIRDAAFVYNVIPTREGEGKTAKEKRELVRQYAEEYANAHLVKLTEARTILAVGEAALWYFTGLESVMKYHGSVFTRDEVEGLHAQLGGPPRPPLPPNVHSLVATLHPAAAMRAGSKFWMQEIYGNVVRARNWSNKPSPKPYREMFDIVLDATPEMVEEELAVSSTFVADLETERHDWRAITVCAVSPRAGRVLVFPWTQRHAAVMKQFFEDPKKTKVGHNFASFDARSLAAHGIRLDGPIFDTINAGSLIWVPVPNKKQQEAGKKKFAVGRLALARCCLRMFDDCKYWKEPATRETQALYRVDWPEVAEWKWEQLYCAQDTGWTGRLYLGEAYMLQREGLHRTYVEYEMPAQLPLARMDIVGMQWDERVQEEIRVAEKRALEGLKGLIDKEAQQYHEKRAAEAVQEVAAIASQKEAAFEDSAACPSHPEYRGRTNRAKSKCGGCRNVYVLAESTRTRAKDLTKASARSRSVHTRIGDRFDYTKDDHWRWLLFDEGAFGFKAPFVTAKTKQAKVNLETMERLLKEHPTCGLVRWRVEAQHLLQSLRGILKVKPDVDGRVRGVRSMNKTATGRTSAGKDDQEPDKARQSPLNFNNIKKKYRRIIIAPPGRVLVDFDYSQIEARIVAWHAQEKEMLALWRDGGDIHVENAVLVARALDMPVPDSRTDWAKWSRTTRFPSEVEAFTMRDAGKTLSHAWNFGMDRQSKRGATKTARDFGIPVEKATAARAAYFGRWRAIDRFQETVLWLAGKNRTLRTSFGRRSMEFAMAKRKGSWVLADVEEALAFVPQSEPSSMIKVCMGLLDDTFRKTKELGEINLITTTYDELLAECPREQWEYVYNVMKTVMEREWPELGVVEGFGRFKCPVEGSIGLNWGDASPENPNGQCSIEAWRKKL